MNNFKDVSAERNVIGGILSIGRNAYIEIQDILDHNDFTLTVNQILYKTISSMFDEHINIEKCEIDFIKNKAEQLGYSGILSKKQESEYIEFIKDTKISLEALGILAFRVKKLSIVRELYNKYDTAKKYLENADTNETLGNILSNAEGIIVDYLSGVDTEKSWNSMSDKLDILIEDLINKEPMAQIGLSTGYPKWDDSIGGGLRPGTISVIGARSKIGKSWLALNQAINIAKSGIPTLYLDTELTYEYQRSRMICIESKCPIYFMETRQFNKDKALRESVLESKKQLDSIPLYYRSISGMNYSDAMSIIRQWIVKVVGFNKNGKANPCCIVYDYFKLTDGSALSKATPEYILLGLMLTSLHDFSVKYEVPIIGYVQLNRDGIDGNDSGIVAGSDRILWLSSSLSFLKNKTEDDVQLGCGFEFGNKKLYISACRHGSGLDNEMDYINLHSSLNPGVDKKSANGSIKEGLILSSILKARKNDQQ